MAPPLVINPVTRVGGGLAVRVDSDGGAITDAHVTGTSFRGFEHIINGRDPRDVMAIASRACGWCGGVHETTASLALEMAWGLEPPPMAHALRSIAQATEAIWVHAAHLAVRAGPDWCSRVVKDSTPWLWDLALAAEAPRAAVHGFRTIAEIMEGLTPPTGRYWRETIPAGRQVLEMISLIYGKYPHPSVLSPGGVGSTLTIGNFTEYYTRLYRSVDYVKRTIALWDDLIEFLYEADPRFAELGDRPASFVHAGCWELEPPAATFDGLDELGRSRLAPPGVMIDGRVVTRSLRQVHDGITEDVGRAFYEGWDQRDHGDTLPAGHPRHRTTVPAPDTLDYDGSYSWCTAPRWHGHVVESTPLGRLWLTASRTDFPENSFIEPTGHSVRILVPKNFLPETVVEWHIPKRVNALERLRADAYGIAFAGLCAAIALLRGFEITRGGVIGASSSFAVRDAPDGAVGLWESGRGMNAHWLGIDDGRVSDYQIVGPSTWNASARDDDGRPGPLEEALIGSPVIEEPGPGGYRGTDALRVIHAFDPCMHCAVH
jgi:hydrogenase large subunit